jgi:hypothetical protein
MNSEPLAKRHVPVALNTAAVVGVLAGPLGFVNFRASALVKAAHSHLRRGSYHLQLPSCGVHPYLRNDYFL